MDPHRFSKRLQIKDQALACMQLWISSLLSITKIKFLLRAVAMATVVSQHVRHLGRHLGFFKSFTFRKLQQILLELVENMCF